ncbi:hypothetical protein CSUI_010074 [Cystoisospora suis]|uniref:Uncharacterized protein n=1 Tax=Cystoisospora suis TaxID=483139 RepID=A0A2C6KI96_9APIC|nr:hypothetical protein CSUI_010074 [Cystoisospora suis]
MCRLIYGEKQELEFEKHLLVMSEREGEEEGQHERRESSSSLLPSPGVSSPFDIRCVDSRERKRKCFQEEERSKIIRDSLAYESKSQKKRRTKETIKRGKRLENVTAQLEILDKLREGFMMDTNLINIQRGEEGGKGERRESAEFMPMFRFSSETVMRARYLQNLYDWRFVLLSQENVERRLERDKNAWLSRRLSQCHSLFPLPSCLKSSSSSSSFLFSKDFFLSPRQTPNSSPSLSSSSSLRDQMRAVRNEAFKQLQNQLHFLFSLPE